jgi:hypothetical protein
MKFAAAGRNRPSERALALVCGIGDRRNIVMQSGGIRMNVRNRTGIYAGLTSLVLISAVAAPALAQTKTFPPGTDCSQLSGSDMAACQNQMSSHQRDGTVGNGATPGAQIAPGSIGGNQGNSPTGGTNNNNLGNSQNGGTQNGGATTNPANNGSSNP